MPNDKSGSKPRVTEAAYRRDITNARKEGFDEGLQKGRQEILDWLENAYLRDPGRPDRGTPKAEAIIELAQAAGMHFNKVLKKGRRK
jgi:hypothetical protein